MYSPEQEVFGEFDLCIHNIFLFRIENNQYQNFQTTDLCQAGAFGAFWNILKFLVVQFYIAKLKAL